MTETSELSTVTPGASSSRGVVVSCAVMMPGIPRTGNLDGESIILINYALVGIITPGSFNLPHKSHVGEFIKFQKIT